MTYCIKRETLIPWDKSTAHFTVQGDIYDVVESHKNTGLESVAEYIIDQGILVKQPINEHDNQLIQFIDAYEATTNTKIQELLLG